MPRNNDVKVGLYGTFFLLLVRNTNQTKKIIITKKILPLVKGQFYGPKNIKIIHILYTFSITGRYVEG